ncbi:MAG: amidohydrolase [Acidobacteriota bacterium]|nr:amidohydrolase [Acidobacteriota bacterium]
MRICRIIPAVFVLSLVVALSLASLSYATSTAQERGSRRGPMPTPERTANQGVGPFGTMAIRGVMLIDGAGGPPRGPTNIIVENNRISRVGGSIPSDADYVVEADGMYLMPGFVDMHVHAGDTRTKNPPEYAYKLWLAHGVTTVRGVGLGPRGWTQREKERSARNEIMAPRIFDYQRPNANTVEQARAWVQEAAIEGIDGMKMGAFRPDIMEALLDEAGKVGLGSTAHLAQTGVAQMNAIDAARLGLGTVTHYYGHFESLLKDYVVQPWPVDMNYNNEQHRFGQVARLWDKIHEPGSDQWWAYLKEHEKLNTVFDPTMTIYSSGRDVMRFREAEWHDQYTLPTLWDFYQPSRTSHGSYWFDWTTWDEVAWRNFYRVWMQMINDYKKIGGRVTTGSDSGFIYQTYGFGYVNELEMLQEAGFHPLEVIMAATMNGALTLHEPKGTPIEFGIVRNGLLADMVIVDANPLHNLKVLYGTGAIKLDDETGAVNRVGGVRWTIKDGILYDAKTILAEVAEMVEEQKASRITAGQ